MTSRRLGMMTLALAAALGCGDDGTSVGDAGPGPEVLFEDLYAEDCAPPACPGRLFESACACVGAPFEDDALEVNRVGCSELAPEGDLARTPADDFCDDAAANAAPDLGCFMAGGLPTSGDPQLVTVYGVVEVYEHGGDTHDITVDIFEEGPDGALGTLHGAGLALVGDPAGPCTDSELEYEGGEPAFERRLGFFMIPDIPTETPLIVRTGGASAFWRDVYEYGVTIPNAEVQAAPGTDACETVAAVTGPLWEYRPTVMSTSDWNELSAAAGLAEGVRSSAGIVMGEVRDCADVRLEHVQVGTYPIAAGRSYFNGDPNAPLPDPDAFSTGVLGRYAMLDVAAGQVDLAAIGRLDGQNVSLGWYRARAFAGAVTSISLHGLRAHQLP